MASHDTKELNDQNFAAEVLESPEPVLVDFWAAWCAPCRAVAPTIEAVARELRGRARVGKLNIDENPEVTRRFGILSIPTFLVFKGGTVVDTIVGALPKAKIRAIVDPHLDGPAPSVASK